MTGTRDDHDERDPTQDRGSDAGVDPETDAQSEPALDPRTDDFVRRLLADARTASPVPGHVAARLDDTLAELLAEREDAEVAEVAEVADLSAVRARRRRRVMVGVGAAAAFVIAAGVALPTIVGQDSSVESDSSADQRVTALDQPGPVSLRAASAKEAVQAYVAGLDRPVATPAPPEDTSPLNDYRSDADGSAAATKERLASAAADALTCEEPGKGEVHPATYDGKPALLVLTGIEDDSVLARVVICDEAADADGSPEASAGEGDSPVERTSEAPLQFVVPQP